MSAIVIAFVSDTMEWYLWHCNRKTTELSTKPYGVDLPSMITSSACSELVLFREDNGESRLEVPAFIRVRDRQTSAFAFPGAMARLRPPRVALARLSHSNLADRRPKSALATSISAEGDDNAVCSQHLVSRFVHPYCILCHHRPNRAIPLPSCAALLPTPTIVSCLDALTIT